MKIIKVPVMNKEQDPLGLSSLPPVQPPTDDWPAIKAALEHDRAQGRRRRLGGLIAVAAVVTLALGISLRAPWPEVSPAPSELSNEVVEQAATEEDILKSLVSLSQQLESQIRMNRERTGSVATDNLVLQVELEDLVALVDEELSRDPESLELWSQRVNLLLDINQIYKNQLRRNYHHMASM